MNKHTPGPWKAHLNVPTARIEGHIIKVDDDVECPIASLWVGGGTEGKPRQKANATLIAAAPDMLEALEELMGAITLEEDLFRCDDLDRADYCRATAAIAKAKGNDE